MKILSLWWPSAPLPDARRMGRKKCHLKCSYCGKSKPYFMILFCLFFYALFLALLHSAPALLLNLSSKSWLFQTVVMSWFWVYDPWMVWNIAWFICLYFGFVCPWKSQISLLWWKFAQQCVAEWLLCSLWSSGMKHSEPGSSILDRVWTCSWSIVSF